MWLAHIDKFEMVILDAFRQFWRGNIPVRTGRTFFTMIVAWHATKRFVVDQFVNVGVRTTDAAVWVLLQLHKIEGHVEGVVKQELADQWLADAEQDLQRLSRLERADRAGQHAQHAALRAGGDESGRRRLGEETAVAGSLFGIEDTHLSI